MLWGNKHKLFHYKMFYTMPMQNIKISMNDNTLGPAARNEWTKDQANQGTYCAVRGAVLG